MAAIREGLQISERRACRALGQARSTQRRQVRLRADEDALTTAIVGLVRSFGRYGYKRITGLLQMAGWNVNAKRVQRIWRAEGLKVPKRQPKRGRLWLNDGSCIRLRPEHRNHVWAYDFVAERTHDGRPPKLLTVVDEYTRECLAISVARRITSHEVLMTLADLGVTTLFIEPASPWENGYIESFNGKLRDELLNGELFSTLKEAQVLIAGWRRLYNGLRPHSSLGQRPPAPETIVWPGFALADWGPPTLTPEPSMGLS